MADFRVLILDDETDILDSVSGLLSASGYEPVPYPSLQAFLSDRAWERGQGAALVDISLGGASGIDAIKALTEKAPEYAVAAISGTNEVRLAAGAIQAGAREFFEKPLEARKILAWLTKVRAASEIDVERRQLLADTLARYELIGSSPEMAAVRNKIKEYAPLPETVLVHGETGTGKELAAAQLHYLSPRRSRPFRSVNIAALPRDLMESQLFGHLKGSFSGASERNEGIILASRGSTLLLDEIGELGRDSQAKLLRALEYGEILSVGSTTPERADARYVCATNRDLLEESARGGFRRDLYYRIAGLGIEIPPLRARAGDIPELAAFFLSRFSQERNFPPRRLNAAALDKLASYPFPGNVRELQSVLLRAALKARSESGDALGADAVDFDRAGEHRYDSAADDAFSKAENLASVKRRLEKRYIETQLALHGHSVSDTADALGILASNLHRRMRSLGID